MKKVDTYLADLLVGNVKLHNLHWNVVGLTFKQVHEYLEDLYDSFFEKFDEVAEYQKQVGVYPKSSVKEYMELTTIEELGDNDIAAKDALSVALDLIKHMKASALAIREEVEDFGLSNMMEDHVAEYTKAIWFMESMLR
ncbi:MAG TPA: DNA starvation/stationary phase protection protein [Clostridiaceae bacterium]|nr:DNA starvation/stationary phase protection protein [Clostridiaceae bacterium]